jgi:hypothetical protein
MFTLKNKDVESWERAQFWDYDPMQRGSLCKICLWIDWRDESLEVETVMHTNSYPCDLHNNVCARFNLPEDTDFTQFPEFLQGEVLPILDELHAGFEYYYDGSNWRGRFSEDVRDLFWELEEALRGAPTHDMQYYFSLSDLYGESGSHTIVEDLKAEDIDLLTANLDDEGIMSLAIEIVTSGNDYDYKLIQVNIEDELKTLQSELREEVNI